MWKNLKSYDYAGLCHYRRFFNFSSNANKRARVAENYFHENMRNKYGWNEREILSQLEKYDIIVARPEAAVRPGIKSIRENTEIYDTRGDFRLWSGVIKKLYPEYYPYYEKYVEQSNKHMFNMFVMRKDLFVEYSEWLFNILFLFEKKSKELTGKDTSRLCGLAGEHLLNIFVLYQIKEKNVRMKELQTIMVNETKVNPSIKEKIIGTSKQIFTVIFPYGSYRRDKIKYKHYFDENKIIK